MKNNLLMYAAQKNPEPPALRHFVVIKAAVKMLEFNWLAGSSR